MRRIWRNNGLSITVFGLFIIFLVGQSLTGWLVENHERYQHHSPPIELLAYLASGSFLEVTAENWESEFLQMFIYVVFTAFLFQRGSSESKSPDEPEEVDRDPGQSRSKSDVPWPVRRGGLAMKVYENSLSLAFLLLFIISFVMHAYGGTAQFNEENLLHGERTLTVGEYVMSSRFWYESFQNWQSEFLAIGSMVVLSIFLRQRGSPESKPVDAPNHKTGGG